MSTGNDAPEITRQDFRITYGKTGTDNAPVLSQAGRFIGGRWVTPAEEIRMILSEASPQETESPDVPAFTLFRHEAEPIFRQGAVIGWTHIEKDMGTFTGSEIEATLREYEFSANYEIRPLKKDTKTN
jgi:hypothetical protein